MNFNHCNLELLDQTDGPMYCGSFAFFIACGRFFASAAWLVAALFQTQDSNRGHWYLSWKVLCGVLPALLYFLCALIDSSSLAWPVIWFLAVGIDIVMNAVPSTFVWMDCEWPRHARYTEERFGMLHVISLAEVVISIVLPRVTEPQYTERYTDVTLIFVMIFVLALYSFVVTDSASSLPPGRHAIDGSWWQKDLWFLCQFVGLTAVLIMGLISRTISYSMSGFDRISFGIAISLVISSGAISQLTMGKQEERSIISRMWRVLIRLMNGAIVFLLSFIPIEALSDTSWLGLESAIMGLMCMVELIGRQRKLSVGALGFVQAKEGM